MTIDGYLQPLWHILGGCFSPLYLLLLANDTFLLGQGHGRIHNKITALVVKVEKSKAIKFGYYTVLIKAGWLNRLIHRRIAVLSLKQSQGVLLTLAKRSRKCYCLLESKRYFSEHCIVTIPHFFVLLKKKHGYGGGHCEELVKA